MMPHGWASQSVKESGTVLTEAGGQATAGESRESVGAREGHIVSNRCMAFCGILHDSFRLPTTLYRREVAKGKGFLVFTQRKLQFHPASL
jgi:hypothetical protein